MKIVATVILDVADFYKTRRATVGMVERLLKDKLVGEISEKIFRGQVDLKINSADVHTYEVS